MFRSAKSEKEEMGEARNRQPHSAGALSVIRNNYAVRDATAGALAGAVARTAVAPIERVKLLMQLQGAIGDANVESGEAVAKKYNSTWDATRSIYKEEGVLAFWRGNTPTVIIQASSAALNFMFMDLYKAGASQILSMGDNGTTVKDTKKWKILSSFISGGLAGFTALTLLHPIVLARTKLAVDVGCSAEARLYPRGMRDVFGHAWKADGVRGLYNGYGIAVCGVTIFRTVYLGGYDYMKIVLIEKHEEKTGQRLRDATGLPLMHRLLAAQSVTSVATIIHYPFDSIRQRMMMQAGQGPSEREYQNSIDCLRRIYAREGMRGYFLGLGPALGRSVGTAMVLVLYDVFKHMLSF